MLSLPGERAATRSLLPRPGCKEDSNPQPSPQGDPAHIAHPRLLSRNPSTHPLVRAPEASALPKAQVFSKQRAGAGGGGGAAVWGASRKRDRPPSGVPSRPRPSLRSRPKTRDWVATPSAQSLLGEGYLYQTLRGFVPPNCERNVGIPGASLACGLAQSGVSR